MLDALPAWATGLLDSFGLVSLGAIQERVSASLMKGSQLLAGHALDIGQGTFDFIANLFAMLYLLFFLLRDRDTLAARLKGAISLTFRGAIAGAVMTARAMRMARTVSAASTGDDRKLKLIAGGLPGSAETMWILPLLSGRIGWA